MHFALAQHMQQEYADLHGIVAIEIDAWQRQSEIEAEIFHICTEIMEIIDRLMTKDTKIL